jgi:hypothetical protein
VTGGWRKLHNDNIKENETSKSTDSNLTEDDKCADMVPMCHS